MATNGNGCHHGKFQVRFKRRGLTDEAAGYLLLALQDQTTLGQMLERGFTVTPPEGYEMLGKQRTITFEVHGFLADATPHAGIAAAYVDTAVELASQCYDNLSVSYNVFAMKVETEGATNGR